MKPFDDARIASLTRDLGEAEVTELLAEFVTQMNQWVAALRQAPVSPRKPLLELAHAIGSSAAMMGALPLERAARALEHHTGSDEVMLTLRGDVLDAWRETERDALSR